METSIFLAKVMGLFGLISAMAIIINYKQSLALEKEAAKSPLFIFTSGFFILMLGITLVVSHSIWTADFRGVITVLCWSVLVKGMGRIFFPDGVRRLLEKKQSNRWFMVGEVVVLILSLYLLYYGFIVY